MMWLRVVTTRGQKNPSRSKKLNIKRSRDDHHSTSVKADTLPVNTLSIVNVFNIETGF